MTISFETGNINKRNNINFRANRLLSVTRYIDAPVQKFEKFDVYKINEKDIPFIKKIFTFMSKRKNKLNDMQKQLYEQFQKILNDEYYFVPGSDDRLYVGIRDENYITGFMKSKNYFFGGNHEVTDLYTSKNNTLEEAAFAYAIQKDTPNRCIVGKIKRYAFYKKDILPNIKNTHSDYHFDSSKPKKEYDLEKELGL